MARNPACGSAPYGLPDMGRGRHAGYADQREMILAKAAALFAQGGYPGTSMNQVAQA